MHQPIDTGRVRIGLAYVRHSFEHRMNGEYRALRPAFSDDAERLQSALLGARAQREATLPGKAFAFAMTAMMATVLVAALINATL